MFSKKERKGEKMDRVTFFGELEREDERQTAMLRQIDCECSQCLYEAGKLSAGDVLHAVIENELTQAERFTVENYWFSGSSIASIAAAMQTSGDNVRHILKRAQKKIYANMKYVVLYDYMLDGKKTLPEDFHFKIINCIDGKELVS